MLRTGIEHAMGMHETAIDISDGTVSRREYQLGLRSMP